MEIRQLQMFQAAAEEGSLTAAANRMRLTQPALSRQIKALEEELGVELFQRGAHSVKLTAAGEVLRGESAKLLRFCEAMVEKVRIEGSGVALRIAYAPSLSREFIALAIERYTQLHERVRILLSDASSAEMQDGLAAGKFDLILTVPCRPEQVEWEALTSYGWRLLVPAAHRLAEVEKVRPEDLAGERMVLLEREAYPDYWNPVTQFFRDRGLQAKVAAECDGGSSLLAAVEAGMGVAVIGETGAPPDGCGARVVVKRMAEEPKAIQVAVGYSRSREPGVVVRSFIEELKRAAAEVRAGG